MNKENVRGVATVAHKVNPPPATLVFHMDSGPIQFPDNMPWKAMVDGPITSKKGK